MLNFVEKHLRIVYVSRKKRLVLLIFGVVFRLVGNLERFEVGFEL
ncbi:hypothetical protein SAMN05216327_106249 [Dyadobacter sp. SG02]|nr:hypothetical protein SAMN05216327_106249 [Dyadobacter sp. SG02]